MGLINWFKDTAFRHLEHKVALIEARLEGFEMRIEQIQSNIISIRNKGVRKAKEEEETPEYDMDMIRKAFGGDVPIELRSKEINR